jgi:alcohol dehydrogenase class IV
MMFRSFTLEQSARIASGPGRIDGLGDDASALAGSGCRVLLIGDRGVERAGLVARAGAALAKAGHEITQFAELDGEPSAEAIDRAAAIGREGGAALVVAVGGGSALDLGKLAAAAIPADRSAEAYALCAEPLPAGTLPIICVPTTAGTGSEVTRTSVLTDREGRKVWAWGDALRPKLALLDPELTTGLPATLTAASGLDALVHAIEAASGRRCNPISDAQALHAIRMIAGHLEAAVCDSGDRAARAAMQVGACLAGLAIDSAGTGIAHALGHALGSLARVPHGRAVALALRIALPWNAAADPGRFHGIAEAMGLGRRVADAALPEALGARFDALLRAVGIDVSLAKDGMTGDDAERLVEVTMAPENRPMLENNARIVRASDAAALSRALLSAS